MDLEIIYPYNSLAKSIVKKLIIAGNYVKKCRMSFIPTVYNV